MWVFGSANNGGSPGASDWTKFVAANPDIIVVTPNHRGGRFGSIDLRQLEGYENYRDAKGYNPYDVSNNIARLDILAALKCGLHKNIAAFAVTRMDVSIADSLSGFDSQSRRDADAGIRSLLAQVSESGIFPPGTAADALRSSPTGWRQG
jgi:hypothetical protein